MSTPKTHPDPDIDFKLVGQIVSASGLLHVFPSETALGEFLVPLLRGVSGVQSVRLCLRKLARPIGDLPGAVCSLCAQGLDPQPEGGAYVCGLVEKGKIRDYPLETAAGFYGHLLLTVEQERGYIAYELFIRNLGNALASLLESRWQQAALQAAKADLEQRVAERTVAISVREQRLEFAFRAAQDGIWDWNVETDEVFYSIRWKAMLGYAEAEIEHHVSAWKRLLHPDDLPRALKVVAAVMHDGREYVTEFRMRHKAGHYVEILSRGFPVRREPEGSIVRIVGTHFDITGRKRVEEELQKHREHLEELVQERTQELEAEIADRKRVETALAQSEKKFRAIFDEAPLGVALINSRTTQICEVNRKFAQIAGRTRTELRVGDWTNITHPDDVQEGLDKMARLLAGEIPGFDMNKRYRQPDGSYTWIHLTVAPIVVEDQTQPRHLAMIEDITERKQAVEQIKTQAAQLAKANDELIRFNRLLAGREVRMIELKQQINDLTAQLGQPQPYSLAFMDEAAKAIVRNRPNPNGEKAEISQPQKE